jgi:hypothetical protein
MYLFTILDGFELKDSKQPQKVFVWNASKINLNSVKYLS